MLFHYLQHVIKGALTEYWQIEVCFLELLTIVSPFCFAEIYFHKFIQSLCYNWSNIVFKNTSVIARKGWNL